MNSTTKHPEELLPWFVNKTLSSQENDEVKAHLQQCETCRDELALLQKVYKQVKQETITPDANEFGLQRLRRDIKQAANSTNVVLNKDKSNWFRPALAAAILVFVVQSVMLVNLWQQPTKFVPLGVQYEGIVLQLSFNPKATESEIRKILTEANGTLIGGPGELGVYRLKLAIDPKSTEQIDSTIAILKSHDNVITHIVLE